MKSTTLIAFILLIINFDSTAQESPVEYMSRLGENYKQISKDTWDYMKQASRGRNAGKIEKRRMELASTLKSAEYRASQMKAYKGDHSLRNSVKTYLHYSYLIINSDYKNIVDLEQIAEQSYDDMEAYLMAKEAVDIKMDTIYQAMKSSEEAFAIKHNINLVESESRLSRKLTNISSLNKYYNKIYLIYFKSSWYEKKMVEALSTGKVSDIEQYRLSLELTSKEGKEELKAVGLYRGDRKLKDACHFMLDFYQNEASKYMPGQVDFYVKGEKMQATAKSFESKDQKSLTQKDVDEYNNSINEYNASIESFNKTNDYLNKERQKKFEAFNKSISAFFSQYM
ncbi:MAG: hypothetical protein ABJF11_08205 [Reichenbachiella sp.]|uniref:hypothetical protein n=1 Tax=Reichenbachiella sp. TaxID=2184521 RepID=UPI0032674457